MRTGEAAPVPTTSAIGALCQQRAPNRSSQHWKGASGTRFNFLCYGMRRNMLPRRLRTGTHPRVRQPLRPGPRSRDCAGASGIARAARSTIDAHTSAKTPMHLYIQAHNYACAAHHANDRARILQKPRRGAGLGVMLVGKGARASWGGACGPAMRDA